MGIFKEEDEGFVGEAWKDFLVIYKPKGVKRILVRSISDMPLLEVYDIVKLGSEKGWECMVSIKNMVLICMKGD